MRALADRQLGHAERRGEIARAEHERLEPGRCGDPLALDEPARGLDLRLRRDGQIRELVRGLDLGQNNDVGLHSADQREIVIGAAVDAYRDRGGCEAEIVRSVRSTIVRASSFLAGGTASSRSMITSSAGIVAARESFRSSSPGTVRQDLRARGISGQSSTLEEPGS